MERRLLPLLMAIIGAFSRANAAIVELGAYPDTVSTVRGTLRVEFQAPAIVTFSGYLVGLEPGVQGGGFHVHVGYTCDDGSAVGPHYFDGLDSDPWNDKKYKYTSDFLGVAPINIAVPSFTLTGGRPVLGRAVVVHNAAGERVGCGLIKPFAGEFVEIGKYPGYRAPTAAL